MVRAAGVKAASSLQDVVHESWLSVVHGRSILTDLTSQEMSYIPSLRCA
jgi:hypothetical protein